MKRLFLSVAILGSLLGTASAQDSKYKSAIGGRLSSGYYDLISASYKNFITEQGALEFDLGLRGRNHHGDDWVTLAFSAAYQHHFPIKPVPGLQWFVGGGLTAYQSFSDNEYYRGFGLGIFPTGGIDYKFGKIPLNLSADVRPTFSIVRPYDNNNGYYDYNSFDGGNVGVSVRYTFR